MDVQFKYGLRGGRWVYVGDLNQQVDRGLSCGCVCPDCGRELSAHLGSKKAWHFQHQVEEQNCNPQPMTQIHAFVRDELARRSTLTIPSTESTETFRELNRWWTMQVRLEAETLDIKSAEVEVRKGSVQPDVVYKLADGSTLALEVCFTHSVSEDKAALLRRSFTRSVEFDIWGLPAEGIGTSALDLVIAEPQRWRWIQNGYIGAHLRDRRISIRWQAKRWQPAVDASIEPVPRNAAPTRLAEAQARLVWASGVIEQRKKSGMTAQDNVAWLGSLEKVDRVAVACSVLGLQPARLPIYFTQGVPGKEGLGFPHHSYSWQVVVFMKFGLGSQSFSAMEATEWASKAMRDRVTNDDGALSINGFSRSGAALHLYLRNLAAQGLLKETGGPAPETVKFAPQFTSKAELHQFLVREPS